MKQQINKFFKTTNFWSILLTLVFLLFILISFEIIGFRETISDSNFSYEWRIGDLLNTARLYNLSVYALIVTALVTTCFALALNIFNVYPTYKKYTKISKLNNLISLTMFLVAFITSIIAISLWLKSAKYEINMFKNALATITYNSGFYAAQYIFVTFGFAFASIPLIIDLKSIRQEI